MDKLEANEKTVLGFWIYLMTDLLMFGALFATFAVLRHNTFGGPAGADLFNLQFVLAETLILLSSTVSAGLALIAAKENNKKALLIWLAATFILGSTFLTMELSEFSKLISEGHSWTGSAFLSAFFTLVGTHGLHIFAGLFWMILLFIRVGKAGISPGLVRKLSLFSLFWHFLDVVWIFIFTIVYLMA